MGIKFIRARDRETGEVISPELLDIDQAMQLQRDRHDPSRKLKGAVNLEDSGFLQLDIDFNQEKECPNSP